MMLCETVELTIAQDTEIVGRVTVPAYTRTPEGFKEQIQKHLDAYLEQTKEQSRGHSVGDFAIFLAVQSSKEPRWQAVDVGPVS